jgi:hypothetical protein
MKKSLTIISLAALVALNTSAQSVSRKCGTPKVNPAYEAEFQKMLDKHQRFANGKTASVVYNIPIVFHILHNSNETNVNSPTDTLGHNLSAAQINSQIAILNADFRKLNTDFSTWVTQPTFVSASADVQINFCPAKVEPTGAILAEPGINRINVASKGWATLPYSFDYIELTVKPNSIWDPTKYFNVWVLEFDSLTPLLGYAFFPVPEVSSSTLLPISDLYGFPAASTATNDGVVVNYLAFGNTGVGATSYNPYNLGRTMTHETGHWLGLHHIFNEVDSISSCSNDFVSDTPSQSSSSSGCPAIFGAVVNSGCAASSNPPGRMYQNYMDYADDKCAVMFTAGQKARMQAVMANCVRRASLATSTVCSVVNSLKENISELKFDLFPNPSTSDISVSVDLISQQNFSILVTNLLGQIVKEIKQNQSNAPTVNINLSDKPRGVYFVTVKTATSVSKTKRFIIQ